MAYVLLLLWRIMGVTTLDVDNGLEQYERMARERFSKREHELYHPTYDEELAFYDMVKSGNLEELKKKDNWNLITMPERGVLSKNPVQSIKYHIIISIAMITRFCIEGGLDEKEAYHLSDIYIGKIDAQNNISDLIEVQKEMTYTFTNRMRKIKTVDNHSVHCRRALDYIYDHLHEPIQVTDVAEFVGLNETYMSKLFQKEMGKSIGVYIRQQKINEAKNMLIYSDVSCAEIAQYLSFASSSHFSQLFKKETGMKPLEYRNKYYRKHW